MSNDDNARYHPYHHQELSQGGEYHALPACGSYQATTLTLLLKFILYK